MTEKLCCTTIIKTQYESVTFFGIAFFICLFFRYYIPHIAIDLVSSPPLSKVPSKGDGISEGSVDLRKTLHLSRGFKKHLKFCSPSSY